MNNIGVIRAIKQIGPGDEMFIDYNQDSFCKACKKDIFFLIWIHQLWKFVLIATKDVIAGRVAKNARNSFVYFVMTISKLMFKLLMFFALIFILIFLLLNLDDDFLSGPLILNLEVS